MYQEMLKEKERLLVSWLKHNHCVTSKALKNASFHGGKVHGAPPATPTGSAVPNTPQTYIGSVQQSPAASQKKIPTTSLSPKMPRSSEVVVDDSQSVAISPTLKETSPQAGSRAGLTQLDGAADAEVEEPAGASKPETETEKLEELLDSKGEEEGGFEADQPPPPKLSQGAINKRLYRICQPRADGSFKVPREVVEDYRDLGKRDNVVALFEKVGYNVDRA